MVLTIKTKTCFRKGTRLKMRNSLVILLPLSHRLLSLYSMSFICFGYSKAPIVTARPAQTTISQLIQRTMKTRTKRSHLRAETIIPHLNTSFRIKDLIQDDNVLLTLSGAIFF